MPARVTLRSRAHSLNAEALEGLGEARGPPMPSQRLPQEPEALQGGAKKVLEEEKMSDYAQSFASSSSEEAIFWLDPARAHDCQIMEKVHKYLPESGRTLPAGQAFRGWMVERLHRKSYDELCAKHAVLPLAPSVPLQQGSAHGGSGH